MGISAIKGFGSAGSFFWQKVLNWALLTAWCSELPHYYPPIFPAFLAVKAKRANALKWNERLLVLYTLFSTDSRPPRTSRYTHKHGSQNLFRAWLSGHQNLPFTFQKDLGNSTRKMKWQTFIYPVQMQEKKVLSTSSSKGSCWTFGYEVNQRILKVVQQQKTHWQTFVIDELGERSARAFIWKYLLETRHHSLWVAKV